MISQDFVEMLRCPANRTPLSLADDALVQRMNEAIKKGRLKNSGGQTVERSVDGGLVREDRALVYPIINDIPILLVDEGIPLDQLGS